MLPVEETAARVGVEETVGEKAVEGSGGVGEEVSDGAEQAAKEVATRRLLACAADPAVVIIPLASMATRRMRARDFIETFPMFDGEVHQQ